MDAPPECHQVLVAAAGESLEDVLPQSPVVGMVGQGSVAFVQGSVAVLEPPDVDELVLLADEDVEVSDAEASKVEAVVAMLEEELAELAMRLDVLVDAVALNVVHLKLQDLLLGRQPLGVGRVLELDLAGLEEGAEDALGLVAVTGAGRSGRQASSGQGQSWALDQLLDHSAFLHPWKIFVPLLSEVSKHCLREEK